jgi:tripartite-type tricarboxylate transporter receptor subunit TctC
VRSDFENLSLMYAGQYVLSVKPDFPAKTFAEFIDYSKAHPDAVFYGSSGVATTTHLAGEMLVQSLGAKLTHVPFKGSPEVFAALLGGEIQAYFDLYGSSKANIESGAIRPIAVSGLNKLAALPDLPTIAESIPGYNVLAWTGFAAPKGTPKDVADKLATELCAVMNSPELQKKYVELGVEPGGNSPEEFNKFVSEQYDMWGKTVQAAGITPK